MIPQKREKGKGKNEKNHNFANDKNCSPIFLLLLTENDKKHTADANRRYVMAFLVAPLFLTYL